MGLHNSVDAAFPLQFYESESLRGVEVVFCRLHELSFFLNIINAYILD